MARYGITSRKQQPTLGEKRYLDLMEKCPDCPATPLPTEQVRNVGKEPPTIYNSNVVWVHRADCPQITEEDA